MEKTPFRTPQRIQIDYKQLIEKSWELKDKIERSKRNGKGYQVERGMRVMIEWVYCHGNYIYAEEVPDQTDAHVVAAEIRCISSEYCRLTQFENKLIKCFRKNRLTERQINKFIEALCADPEILQNFKTILETLPIGSSIDFIKVEKNGK